MDAQRLISRIADAITPDPRLQALLLAGSHGRGTADQFSDIDLLAFVPGDDLTPFAADWRCVMEDITPIVFWNRWGNTRIVINAVTRDWARVDLVLRAMGDIVGLSAAHTRILHDKIGIATALPAQPAPYAADTSRLLALINEFIRVLGLLPVVVGRGELVTAVAGDGLQRAALTNLMIAELELPDAGGALHLSRTLRPDQMAVLQDIPYPQADATQVVEAHAALARAFLPRARRLAERAGITWPVAFEAATLTHLQQTLGLAIPPTE
jgi:Streptomycin adenylyltransferase